MLVLARKQNQTIVIDGRITVTIGEIGETTVRICVEAPKEVNIRRGELPDETVSDNPGGLIPGESVKCACEKAICPNECESYSVRIGRSVCSECDAEHQRQMGM